MTKFANKTFSSAPSNQAYRDSWDRVFGEKSGPSCGHVNHTPCERPQLHEGECLPSNKLGGVP